MLSPRYFLAGFLLFVSGCAVSAHAARIDEPKPPPAAADRAPPADDKDESPVVAAKETTYDWGELYHGEVVEHRFELENRSTQPLRLRGVETSCGCTFASADVPEGGVPPGGTLSVRVWIETAKLPSDQVVAKDRLRKSAQVIADDGRTLATLWMEGLVQELLAFEPAQTTIRIIHDDLAPPPDPVRVHVSPLVDEKLEILGVEVEKKAVSAKATKRDEDGAFDLVLEPDLSRRDSDPRTAETVYVRVRIGETEVRVPHSVAIIFERRIRCDPSASCFFSRVATRAARNGGELPRRELELRSLGAPKHHFAIREIEVEKGLVRVSSKTVEKGRRYQIVVELAPPAEGAIGVVHDRIVVSTDDPLASEIEIPVTIQW